MAAYLLIAACTAPSAMAADDDVIRQGIKEYNAGDYANAAGHLNQALSTNFNNATLHYYLGHSYMHMKETSTAIREFRIAYALQPNSDVGKYSKTALSQLGVGVTDDKPKETAPVFAPTAPAPAAPSDPYLDKAINSMKQQAENAKATRNNEIQNAVDSMAKSNADLINRIQEQMKADNQRYSRRGTPYPTVLGTDQQKQLDAMKQGLEAQKSGYLDHSARQVKELEKTTQNLQDLFNSQAKPGEAKLVPAGTNLYIRNYAPVKQTTPPTK